MSSNAVVDLVRSAIGIVVAPISVGAAGLAIGAPAVVTLGALAVAVMIAARRLGREPGMYAALIASAVFAGVYATTHHGATGSAGRSELAACALLLGLALTIPGPRRAVPRRDGLPAAPVGPYDVAPYDGPWSEIPDAGGVAAHDELALVGGNARELLVDKDA
jgi:hypothetical protein